MTLKRCAIIKSIVTLLILILPLGGKAQWKKSETLTGGSIVSDMIVFDGNLYAAVANVGIFKSADNGSTWTQLTVPAQPNFTHFAISGNTLLAVSYGKTFSTLNGDQWNEGAGPDGFINDVGSDGGPNIFAATSDGLFQSGDGGVTWARNGDTRAQPAIKSVAVKGSTVWAGTDSPAAGTLLKSEDSGATWSVRSMGTLPIKEIVVSGDDVFLNISYDAIYKSTNSGTDWQIVRNLSNAMGTLHAGPSALYFLSFYNLYSSSNGGDTWTEKPQRIPFYNFQTLCATDQHVLVGLWGGGIVRTNATGDSDWTFANNGIAAHEINDLVVAGSIIYAGLENSFIRSSADDGNTWTQMKDTYGLFAGSGRALHSTGTTLFVGSGGGGVQRSSDSGTTWALKSEGLVSKNVLQFTSVGNAIFVGTDDGVYKSLNNGDSWTKKTGEMAMLRTLYSDGTNIYAGTYDGLFHSKDTGETWTRISSGLPHESIGAIQHMGAILYAATQFNGLYKTTNYGESWEKLNSEYVQVLTERNNVLFMSTLDNQLLVSYDSGRTAEDVAASMPPGAISAIDFTQEHILIGKDYSGLWKRKLSEIVPPHLNLHLSPTEDKFFVGTPIIIESDQPLYSAEGNLLSEVSGYITVTDSGGSSTPYSAEINAEKTLITIHITDAINGENYTISIDGLHNEYGLASLPISRVLSATVNNVPHLSEASIEANQGQIIEFNAEMFSVAFADSDGDELAKLMVKGLPSHGTLKLDDTPVAVNQEIARTSLGQLSYTAASDFSGEDFWFWNGSDGVDYSPSDVKMTIVVMPVTSVYPEIWSKIRLYPNPVTSRLNIETPTLNVTRVDILDVVGGKVELGLLKNIYQETPLEVDLTDLPPGIYMVRMESSKGITFQQKIIKQ